MLVALVTLLFIGGDGGLDVFSKEHRKAVVEVVQDADRAAAAIDEMKVAQKELDKKAKEIDRAGKSWARLDEDLASGRTELESAMRESDVIRRGAWEIFADSIFALRERITREEWLALVQRDSEDG